MIAITKKIKTFFSYLWGKKTELADMDEKDMLLGKVVLDIHRKRSHSSSAMVPLFQLLPIHPINREASLAATKKRIENLNNNRHDLLQQKDLTKEVLVQYIPSVSGIKVVQTSASDYVAYEGNGRLAALQEVFGPEDNIMVEVELYHFRHPGKIIRRINRVRRLHKLDRGSPMLQWDLSNSCSPEG